MPSAPERTTIVSGCFRAFLTIAALGLASCAQSPVIKRNEAVEAFQTVHAVFMHPRCQNCHIPAIRRCSSTPACRTR
jgi:hypothetical protein